MPPKKQTEPKLQVLADPPPLFAHAALSA